MISSAKTVSLINVGSAVGWPKGGTAPTEYPEYSRTSIPVANLIERRFRLRCWAMG